MQVSSLAPILRNRWARSKSVAAIVDMYRRGDGTDTCISLILHGIRRGTDVKAGDFYGTSHCENYEREGECSRHIECGRKLCGWRCYPSGWCTARSLSSDTDIQNSFLPSFLPVTSSLPLLLLLFAAAGAIVFPSAAIRLWQQRAL